MQYSKILTAALVGFSCMINTVSAKTAKGEHDIVKRSFTKVYGGCTAVCKDDLFNDCQVSCAPEATAKPVFQKRENVVTVTNNGCTAVCWDKMPGTDCDVDCGGTYSTHMTLPTSDPTPAPLPSHKRSFTTTQGICTAVCWDLLPGTGCDVQCRESGITKMPSPTAGVPSLWKTTFTTQGCGVTCQDLMPGTECGLSCSGTFPTQAPVAALADRMAIEARGDVQVREAHDARLARKFGLGARDDECTPVTVTVTTIPAYCATTAAVFPAMMPAAATSGAQAPSGVSQAVSEAQSFLSSVSAAAAITPPSSAMTTPASPASSGTAITVSLTSVGNQTVSTATLTSPVSTLTSTAAATTTIGARGTSANPPEPASQTIITGGAPSKGMSLHALVRVMIIGMIGHGVLLL